MCALVVALKSRQKLVSHHVIIDIERFLLLHCVLHFTGVLLVE